MVDQTLFVLSMTGIWHSDGAANLLILSIDLKALIHQIKIPSWQITDLSCPPLFDSDTNEMLYVVELSLMT